MDKTNIVKGFTYIHNKTYWCNEQAHNVEEYRHDRTGMEFVRIPEGSFMMGGENGSDDEKPAHSVSLSSFLISKTQVTQGVWQEIMKTTPWKGKKYVKEGSNYPATYVSWDDAKKFCDDLNLALPTEAQWEYACRSGSDDEYYWGNSMNGDYAWYFDNTRKIANKYAYQVAQKNPNAFGLYDMSGNVWEWCNDWYDANYYSTSRKANPKGPDKGSDRVFRGGSWSSIADICRSHIRYYYGPGFCNCDLGFRSSFNSLPLDPFTVPKGFV